MHLHEEESKSKIDDLMNFLDNVDQAMPSSRSHMRAN